MKRLFLLLLVSGCSVRSLPPSNCRAVQYFGVCVYSNGNKTVNTKANPSYEEMFTVEQQCYMSGGLWAWGQGWEPGKECEQNEASMKP